MAATSEEITATTEKVAFQNLLSDNLRMKYSSLGENQSITTKEIASAILELDSSAMSMEISKII